ncbi:unnamed protein product [Dimorphilus gyrociliatus]|uniref:G-protein coupled receptors family 1 profile domain-containing protein n=1 Tax=Dimorphilus gyrociliatus TaxID=2664684 RepID=A0A7I8WCM0_9ANNE|nr:unnamed protein product [Dimorphilus gyrociliatus]
MVYGRVNNSLNDTSYDVNIYNEIAYGIIKYFFPFSLLIGTFANCFIVYIMRKKSVKSSVSVSIILCLLAVSDTTVLWTSEFRNWSRVAFNYDFIIQSDISCKFTKYLFYSSSHFSNWLVASFSIERMLVVWTPLNASRFCRSNRLATYLGLLITCIFGSNISWAVYSRIKLINGLGKECATEIPSSNFISYIPLINMILTVVMPFAIVLIGNSLIIVGLIRGSNRIEDGDSVAARNQRRITIGLVVTAASWLLLTFPQAIMEYLRPLIQGRAYFLSQTVGFSLLYLNHSINFFIYVLSAKTVRRELQKSVLCRLCNQNIGREERLLRVPVIRRRADVRKIRNQAAYPMILTQMTGMSKSNKKISSRLTRTIDQIC